MNKLHALKLKTASYSCKILPYYGAALQSYKFDNQDFVNGYASEVEMDMQKYKGVILAPFPNRLAQAKYSFKNKRYTLPINREKESLALHGFLYDKVFQVEDYTDNKATLSYNYDKELQGYPFTFKLTVVYHLHEDGTLQVSSYVKNKADDTLLFGLGWHPYFTMNQCVDSLHMSFDAMQQLVLDEKKIPSGVRKDFAVNQNGRVLLKEHSFDDCFQFINEKDNKVSLQNEKYVLEVKMDSKDFPYVQIYIPKDRASVAIEPMTCPPNAFNTKESLWQLNQHDTRSASYSLKVFKL